jgi:hypothetical protein
LSRATSTISRVSTVSEKMRPVWSLNAMRLPSGDHTRPRRRALLSFVSCSAAPEPSCATSQISSSPDRSETNATLAPSGDQIAPRSCASDEWVRFRVGPFSTGALNTSPRATTSTRSPFGLIPTPSMRSAADTREGRIATPSFGTTIESFLSVRAFVSKTCSSPPPSYTISPFSPLLGQRTSQSVLFVSCSTFCDSTSYE